MNIVEWRDNLLDSPLNYKAKYLGLVLSQFYRRGSLTYPSIRTLSKLCGLTVNPIQEGIQMLIDAKFINRSKERISGDRYLSNIYTFNGVAEKEHVSPGDVSRGDTSPGDTSNDTSNDTSPRDTKVGKEDKVGERGLPLRFEDLTFNKEFEKIGAECGLNKETSERSFNIWKIKRRLKPPKDWYGDFWVWCLNEKEILPGSKTQTNSKTETEEEGRIRKLGNINFKRKLKGMIIGADELRFITNWEAENNTNVWWDNLRQYKERKDGANSIRKAG